MRLNRGDRVRGGRVDHLPVLAQGLRQLLRSLLFGVSATDPVTYAALAALLCGVALVASVVAGRRATSVDPALALRAE